MLPKKPVLIDNDALVNLTHTTGMLFLLRNIFSNIYIPQEIKNEYERMIGREPKRAYVLNLLKPNSGFWSLCTRFDIFSTTFLFTQKGIDRGEAELISQSEKIGVRLIISDDRKFKLAADALNKNFQILPSFYVIAVLDIAGFIADSKVTFQEMYQFRKFKSKELRAAYEIALKEYGIKWTKKKLSEKTGLKALGIKK